MTGDGGVPEWLGRLAAEFGDPAGATVTHLAGRETTPSRDALAADADHPPEHPPQPTRRESAPGRGEPASHHQPAPAFTRLAGGGVPGSASPDPARVFANGRVVIKLHARRTRPAELAARVRALTDATLAPLFVQPLGGVRVGLDGSLATAWPQVETLTPADDPPWAEAGRLLARLHRVPPPGLHRVPPPGLHRVPPPGLHRVPPPALPAHGGPDRLDRALSWLRSAEGTEASLVREVATAVAAEVAERNRTASRPLLAHGDWHLGQLGRVPGEAEWRLLDPDDLGVGDAAWDLARPAGFWAAGLLDNASWETFLGAYREAGGPAVPDGDPWPALDAPARAAVAIAAAGALRRGSHSAPTAEALLAACRRMHHG